MTAFRGVRREAEQDHLSLISAGVAFFGFVSIFPGIAALTALYGLLFERSAVEEQMNQLRGLIPAEALSLLEAHAQSLVQTAPSQLTWNALIAVGVALYTASAGTRGLIQATNLAYDCDETRGLIRFNIVALGLTLGTIGTLIIILSLTAGVPMALALAGGPPQLNLLISWLRWPALLAIMLFALAALSYFGLNRTKLRFQWITPGSLLSTIGIVFGSWFFSFYVTNFGRYDQTYGSIGAIVVFMLWLYVVSFMILLGSELNAELERAIQPHK